VHDVPAKVKDETERQTQETAAPESAAVHVECQMIPLIAGVMNLRMMPEPK
jgi:hypothetical protein